MWSATLHLGEDHASSVIRDPLCIFAPASRRELLVAAGVAVKTAPPMCSFIPLLNEYTSRNLHCFTDSRQKFAFVGWFDGGACAERCAWFSPNSRMDLG